VKASDAPAAPPSLVKQALDLFKWVVVRKGQLTAVAGSVVVLWTIYHETETYITGEMVEAFEQGSQLQPSLLTVDRDDVHKELRHILAPSEKPKTYFVVMGEKGVGKSTAARQVLSELPHPHGALYFLTGPTGRDALLQDLTRALRYRKPFQPWVRFRRWLDGVDAPAAGKDSSQVLLQELSAKLLVVGQAYVRKHGRVPVLVLDAVDIVHHRTPEFLAELQTLAKAGVDLNVLRIVFIMSERASFDMLANHSHASRMCVFVVGDVSDPQATQYLVALGVPPDTASDAVARITGGRFDLLHRFVVQQQRGQVSNDEILVSLSGKTEYWMQLDHVATTSPLFRAMLSGPVTSVQAVEIAGPDAVAALVERNIISIDDVSNEVTFSARHVKTLLAEKLAEQQQQQQQQQQQLAPLGKRVAAACAVCVAGIGIVAAAIKESK
jgi:hypothetical protein